MVFALGVMNCTTAQFHEGFCDVLIVLMTIPVGQAYYHIPARWDQIYAQEVFILS